VTNVHQYNEAVVRFFLFIYTSVCVYVRCQIPQWRPWQIHLPALINALNGCRAIDDGARLIRVNYSWTVASTGARVAGVWATAVRTRNNQSVAARTSVVYRSNIMTAARMIHDRIQTDGRVRKSADLSNVRYG